MWYAQSGEHPFSLVITVCLAYPGKIVEVEGDFAKVDFGEGTIRSNVNVSLVDAGVGDYVLVHAGYAIQKMKESQARETITYWKEILASQLP